MMSAKTEYDQKWREANPEKVRAYARKYYWQRKERNED